MRIPVSSTQACLVLLLALAVRPVAAEALFQILDAEVDGNARGVAMPVLLDNEEPVYAFQLSIVTDPSLLFIDSVSTESGVAEAAEFSLGRLEADGSAVSWGVVLDLSEPFDPSSFIPQGAGQEIARVFVNVGHVTDETVTQIRFENRPADEDRGVAAAINKVVREEGANVELLTIDGEVTIAPSAGPIFLRGNANHDNAFDLSDGVYTLNFLFSGGPDPQCFDAADTTDDGVVDLSDAVYSFNSLFLGGPPPDAPYPSLGPDPTDDPLDCERSQAP